MKSASFAAMLVRRGLWASSERRARRSEIGDHTVGRGRHLLYGDRLNGGKLLRCPSDDPRYRPCHRTVRVGFGSSYPPVSTGLLSIATWFNERYETMGCSTSFTMLWWSR